LPAKKALYCFGRKVRQKPSDRPDNIPFFIIQVRCLRFFNKHVGTGYARAKYKKQEKDMPYLFNFIETPHIFSRPFLWLLN